MIIRRGEGVLVQGITGRQARFWTARMAGCGTRLVAGTSPGHAGETVEGVPVYATVGQATADHQVDASVLFVPPGATMAAAVEAIEAGVGKLVVLTEHVPSHDVMELLAHARDRGARVLGPNTAGLVVPGETSVGIMPGFAANIFQPGRIGVVSRSGSLGTLVCLYLVSAGYGQSAFVGVGGDPILGTTTLDAVRDLHADGRTDAIVLVGEIGGSMEEEAAGHLAGIASATPMVAFVAGRSAPPGRRMGHAGAIVSGGRGEWAGKVAALRDAGVTVVDLPGQIGGALAAAGVHPTRPGQV